MQLVISDPNRISARVFDDEVVIANFDNGLYYSLVGSAAQVWTALAAGAAVAEVTASLAGAGMPAAAVTEFIDRLQQEGLLKAGELPADALWQPQAPPPEGWQPPVLESFSDMQDLLLLDPVYDAGEAGWPYTAES